MNQFLFGLGWLLLLTPGVGRAQPQQSPPEFAGWVTNSAALMRGFRTTTTTISTQSFRVSPRMATNTTFATNPITGRLRTNSWTSTNLVFEHFLPGTLNHLIWTNYLALTNGRDMRIWSERSHPAGWPTNPPVVKWNTNSVIWGMKGVTALSPCWAAEGASGQVPLTLLTRRHAYTRGHHIGNDGINPHVAGFKAWFVTRDNVVVEAITKLVMVRIGARPNGPHRDYTVLLFDRDLPDTIEAMSVALPEEVQKFYAPPAQGLAPHPIFQTEQNGFVSTGVAPLTVNTWKGGDSGSPNLVPLPGELVFFSGRSTSGPSRAMQEDIDELCRLEGLNPAKYQMHWVDLGKYLPK